MERNQWIKNRAVLVAVVAAMATWAIGVDADSHGAPLSSCEKMGVIHAVFPSKRPGTCPFGITFDQTEISNDGTLGVTLSAKPDFQDVEIKRGPELPGYFTGYLLMAFDANNEEKGPIGFFSGIDSVKGQYLDCFNLTRSAVTHVNPNFKPEIKVEWNPPENWSGFVRFRASFTANIATIWAQIPSDIICVRNATTETTAIPTSTTAIPTSTTAEPTSTTVKPTSTTAIPTEPTSTTAIPTSTTAEPTSTATTPTTTTTTATTTTMAPTTEASAGHLSGSWMMTIFAIALASTPFIIV